MCPENPLEDFVLQEDPKGTLFAKAMRNALVRAMAALLRSSVLARLCRPGLRVGEGVTG